MTESHDAPPHERPRAGEESGPALERLLFFSDAVFAIALTLLALELPVPEGDSDRALWQSFLDHLDREYLTFLISFLVISRFWMVHHAFFARAVAADRRLIQLNLVYLLWIVLLPFATKVLGDDGGYTFGTTVYAATVALVGITFGATAWYCARAGLVAGAANRIAGTGSLVVAGVFLLSIPIAFWRPGAAQYFWLVLVLAVPATGRLGRRGAPTPGPPEPTTK